MSVNIPTNPTATTEPTNPEDFQHIPIGSGQDTSSLGKVKDRTKPVVNNKDTYTTDGSYTPPGGGSYSSGLVVDGE